MRMFEAERIRLLEKENQELKEENRDLRERLREAIREVQSLKKAFREHVSNPLDPSWPNLGQQGTRVISGE